VVAAAAVEGTGHTLHEALVAEEQVTIRALQEAAPAIINTATAAAVAAGAVG